MNQNQIIEKVNEAKKYLGIDLYPGNLFERITSIEDFINTLNILLVKLDIGKTSGFIGYVEEVPVVCINYKRTIGHQNFTLGHELGHYFLHKGMSMSDEDSNLSDYNNTDVENEANQFAKELLYPSELVINDLKYIKEKNLFSFDKSVYDELGVYINSLCEKYYISFDFACNRLVEIYKKIYNISYIDYKMVKKFKKSRQPYYERYADYMYNTTCDHEFYKPYNILTKTIENYANVLVEHKKISPQTAKSIVRRSKKLEE